jgi:hypothetical protein
MKGLRWNSKRAALPGEPRAKRRHSLQRLLALTVLLPWAGIVGCQGGVNHPPPGQPNDPEYCANRSEMEDNCMACSSQPGCGYCNEPVAGQAHCQAGASQTMPATCQVGWAFSTEECAPPPPPPPME